MDLAKVNPVRAVKKARNNDLNRSYLRPIFNRELDISIILIGKEKIQINFNYLLFFWELCAVFL
jgi:hypothetical protein